MNTPPEPAVDLEFEPFATDRRYAFSPSVAAFDGQIHAAWLQVTDDLGAGGAKVDWGATLRTTAGTIETGETPRRPTLLAGPDSGHLLWTAETATGWPLFHAPIDTDGVGDTERLTNGDRPPIDITGCRTDDGIAVVWESTGSPSQIRGCEFADGTWTDPRVLSGDCDGAYDATLAPGAAADASDRYLLYTALRDGWYEVAGRRLIDGEWADPEVLSRQPGLVAYPTVVGAGGKTVASGSAADAAAPVGPTGAWVGWVLFEPGERGSERPYVDHRRREDQHAPFRGQPSIHVFHWDGEHVRSPVYDREWGPVTETNDVSGVVLPAGEGTRPALMGGDALRIGWLDHRPDPQEEYTRDVRTNRPRIAVSRFDGDRWADVMAGPVYGDAERLHHTLVRDSDPSRPEPVLAAGRDTRPMGGWENFETGSHDGRCIVGTIRLGTGNSKMGESAGPRAADEPTLQRQNRWVHARRDARNPSVDATSDDNRELLFLNLHRHTDLSVCLRASDGEPDFNVRLARDLVREDVVCLTDHCYNADPIARFKTDRGMRTHHETGIVTIPSYEWTGTHRTASGEHYGHFNIHWFDDGVPPLGVPNTAIAPSEPDALADSLTGHDALAIPHHTANRSHYLRPDLFDFPHSPVVEIFQATRGTCEERDGPGATEFSDTADDRCYVRSALQEGQRLGFVGGGDHAGIALTGVWVTEASRRGVYEALHERRCFATTGTTLAVDATVGDTPMGATHQPPEGATSVTYELNASVPDGIETIQLVRDGDVVARVDGQDDATPPITVDRDPDTDHYVYARLLLSNGEVAWASPIWIAADD